MKEKRIIYLMGIFIIGVLLFMGSCEDDPEPEPTNEPPTCTITSPTNNAEFPQDSSIKIFVEAKDNDGYITEVRYYVDNLGVSSSKDFPYVYNWNTQGISLGNHKIRALAIDNDGAETSDEIIILVKQFVTNTIPTASFTVSPSSGETSTNFSFDASGSSDNQDSVSYLQVRWDWENDGIWDVGYTTAKTTTHQYSSDGTYTVKMEVKDLGGMTDSTSKIIVVSPANTTPTASFTVSPSSGTTLTNFSFDASGSSDNEDPLSSLEIRWDWENDGIWDVGYTTTKTTTHQYSSDGTYTVKMEVKDLGALTNVTTKTIVVSSHLVPTTPSNMNIVLEDFTGVRCGYCPDGHAIAKALEDAYPGRIIVIGVNAGSYADPKAGYANFTTPFGQNLINQSQVAGYPAGTINRHKFTGTAGTSPYWIQKQDGLALSRGGWKSAAEALMSVTSPVNIGTQITWVESTRELTVEVHLYYTGTETEANNLNVALIESGQIAKQSNYGSGEGDNYVHPNVLRDFITGQWGEVIPTTTEGTTYKKQFKYTVPADYNGPLPEGGGTVNINNCDIAIFVARGQTEILTGIRKSIIQ